MKHCGRCGDDKLPSEFYRQSSAPDGLQYQCKECCRKSSAEWAVKNKARLRALQRKWALDHRDQINAWQRAYFRNNPEKRSSGVRNPAKRAVWEDAYAAAGKRAVNSRRWRTSNPARAAAVDARKKHAKCRAVPAWYDAKSVSKVYEEARRLGFQVDHVVPINSRVVCGLHVHSNLQLLDKQLNISKGNRHWPDMP